MSAKLSVKKWPEPVSAQAQRGVVVSPSTSLPSRWIARPDQYAGIRPPARSAAANGMPRAGNMQINVGRQQCFKTGVDNSIFRQLQHRCSRLDCVALLDEQ
jgi:hypothetical protein